MKLSQIALTILLSGATALGVMQVANTSPSGQTVPAKETAYERVMRTRTLRCAYGVRPPHIIIDPNTKKLSGIDHDVIEAIGKASGLTILWQDEVGYGAFAEQLNGGKQDAYCSLVLVNARRAQRVEPTQAVTYDPMRAYVREADTRFDNNSSPINVKDVKLAVIDGTPQKAAADSAFPNASQYAVPGDSDLAQVLMTVTTGKADIAITDGNMISDHNAHNPTMKLREILGIPPVRIFGDAFAVAKGETELRDFLNAAIQEAVNNGLVDRLITKYEIEPGAIMHPAQPYAPVSK